MQMKEVEEKTGLARSHIRFYEKQNLITPARKNENGYREYSREDVQNIRKIAYLRTLGISIEEIRNIVYGKSDFREVLILQEKELERQRVELESAQKLCRKMLQDEKLSYQNLNVEQYMSEVDNYWKDNIWKLKADAAGTVYNLGTGRVWMGITILSLLIAICSFAFLPDKIPIQWNEYGVSSEVNRIFIFAYPVMCVFVRYWLRHELYGWLRRRLLVTDETLTDFVTNMLCAAAVVVEVISIL